MRLTTRLNTVLRLTMGGVIFIPACVFMAGAGTTSTDGVRLGRYSIHILHIMKVWVSNIVLCARCYEVFCVSLGTST